MSQTGVFVPRPHGADLRHRDLPEIERTRKIVRLSGYTHKLVVVHVEKFTTKIGRRVQRCACMALEEGVIVYAFLGWPEDTPNASWIWEDVLEHPEQVEPGMIFYAKISHDVFQDETRNRVGKLFSEYPTWRD